MTEKIRGKILVLLSGLYIGWMLTFRPDILFNERLPHDLRTFVETVMQLLAIAIILYYTLNAFLELKKKSKKKA